MDIFRELIELLTSNLDRDRVQNLIPVHLKGMASQLERDAVNESFIGLPENLEIYSLALWTFQMAEFGQIPLRAHESRMLHRIMARRSGTWSGQKLPRIADIIVARFIDSRAK